MAKRGGARPIPVATRISPEEFFEQYYYANRPVILRGLMRGWRARRVWSPGYFARQFGNLTVEIAGERDRDPDYDSNFDSHRRRMRMSEFVRAVKRGATNDIYISGKNGLLRRKGFESLADDLGCPRGFVDPKMMLDGASVFFGPKGTVTPLHFDGTNSLFGQIYGRKRVKLVAPHDMENVYAERYCFSAVDMERINFRRFPRMRRATVLEAVIEPGEFLFLPMGWYHWIKALDVSISVSMQNLCAKGGVTMWRFWER